MSGIHVKQKATFANMAFRLAKHQQCLAMNSVSPLTIPSIPPEEERYITIGWSNRHRLLMAAHTDRDNRIRIVGARELTPREQKTYEKENI